MHTENKIIDGFFEIRQNVCNFRTELYRFGVKLREIQPGRLLTLDELHDMLISERSELLRLEGSNDDE